VERERFEEVVRQALETVPEEIAERMSNVDVEVQDWATPRQLTSARVTRGTLLGLYQGIPLTRRTSGYNMVPPDKIIIFQGPLEHIARDEDDLVRRVRSTVVHEVAHHFGISDARLRQIEAERQ
jgi:predicted Zn-dependent protease with MMP-like domain